MSTLLLIGAAALLLLAARKQSAEPVGKVKFYKALAEAQAAGVEFGATSGNLTEDEKTALDRVGKRNNYRQSKRSQQMGRSYAEAFYRYLNGKYKQIAGIGEIEYPFTEYIVRNENGDPIVIFHDYDRETDLRNALDAVDDYANSPELYGEMATYAYIATGGKFVWDSKFVGGTERVAAGVKDELFGSRRGTEDHAQEKKSRRRILATEAKGGKYPVRFAEVLAAGGDSRAVLNGVLSALRTVRTPQEAQDVLLGAYYKQFDRKHPERDQVPF